MEREILRAALAARFETAAHPLRFAAMERVPAAGWRLARVRFADARGEPVAGWFGGPDDDLARPALLYIHAHGNRHAIGAAELVEGRPALLSPLGPVFAAAGWRTLCLDLPCFGARAAEGESAAAKAALWHGRSLAGRMLGELSAALGWLATAPGVDPDRLGAFGISMGATFAYWLAAVEPRLKAVAHLCCYADFDTLIETGAHDLHGPYLTVPGLLDLAANGTIAGLVAPRAQLIGLGAKDPLTPPAAIARALLQTRAAYAGLGGRLDVLVEPEAGHEETSAARAAVLRFFAETL